VSFSPSPEEKISHNQVTGLLASPAQTSADLRRMAKPLARRVEIDDGVPRRTTALWSPPTPTSLPR
jgi:hypothetical protein